MEVTLSGTAGGEAVKIADAVQTLSEENGWEYTWTGLDKKYNGTDIDYTLTETETEVITGTDAEGQYAYEVSGSAAAGFTVTNTHTPEALDISVKKAWADGDDQDRIRPESVEVTLSGTAGGEAVKIEDAVQTLSEKNGWTYTWTNLAAKYQGKDIDYTLTETETEVITGTDAEGQYAYEVTGSALTGFTVTNTHTPEEPEPELISVQATKVWDDEDDKAGKREDVSFELLADGKPAEGQETKTIAKDAAGDALTVTWTGLPKLDGDKEIAYTVIEVGAEDGKITLTDAEYTVTVSGSMAAGFKITNAYTPEPEPEPELISVQATKVWDDEDDKAGKREDVTFELLADGKPAEGQERKKIAKDAAGDALTVTWTGLPKLDGEKEIAYTVAEVGEKDGKITLTDAEYTVTVSGDMATGFKITNAYTPEPEPELLRIPVKKVWEDNYNAAKIRPNRVVVELLADGTRYAAAELSEGNKWSVTFSNLPKEKDGKAITYTLTEVAVPGYQTVIEGSAEEGFTVTNYNGRMPPRPPRELKSSFSCTKIWVGGSLSTLDGGFYGSAGYPIGHGLDSLRRTVRSRTEWFYEATFDEDELDDRYVIEAVPEGYEVRYENVGVHAGDTDRCYDGGKIINYKLPKTGDEAEPLIWLLMAAGGIAGACALLASKKHRKEK